MKLYATVTSERASKGQGGNKYLDIEIRLGSSSNSKLVAIVNVAREESMKGYGVNFRPIKEAGASIFFSDAEIEGTKGKQQKGKECGLCGKPITDRNLMNYRNGEPRHSSCS